MRKRERESSYIARGRLALVGGSEDKPTAEFGSGTRGEADQGGLPSGYLVPRDGLHSVKLSGGACSCAGAFGVRQRAVATGKSGGRGEAVEEDKGQQRGRAARVGQQAS